MRPLDKIQYTLIFLVVAPEYCHEEHQRNHIVDCLNRVGHSFFGAIVEDLEQFASQKDEVGQLQQNEELSEGKDTW